MVIVIYKVRSLIALGGLLFVSVFSFNSLNDVDLCVIMVLAYVIQDSRLVDRNSKVASRYIISS